MTKLETIAEAIYEHHEGPIAGQWDRLPDFIQGFYRSAARAAVEAMREPTKEMVVAGDDMKENCIDSDWDSDRNGNRHYSTTINSDLPSLVYRAMIDAILTEEKL